MPRLQSLLECVGLALCEKGRKALEGRWTFAEVLPEVARVAFDHAHRRLPGADLREALTECAATGAEEFDRRIAEVIPELSESHSVPKSQLTDYLRGFPATVRQSLRRPTEPDGHTAPDKLLLYKPEELAVFLPPRPPRFRAGDRPRGLDGWQLTELRGLGQCSEVWRAEDPAQGHHSPAAIKFVTDPELQDRVSGAADLFTRVFELNGVPGILPLRSVYLETDPPCLEAPYVYGYDLAGLMFDWRWRYSVAKPEAALKLMRRLAAIVGEAHSRGIVHRDLKPSNILLHPTEGGKFTLWVSDFGWGQVESARELELVVGAPRGEQQRLATRGAATALYASPQQLRKEPPLPVDDVHALGVIWYQLLRRDPTTPAPVGIAWAEELRPAGLTDSQARVLHSCLSPRPDRRPKNAAALAEMLAKVTVAPQTPGSPDGSNLIALRNPGSAVIPPPAPLTKSGSAPSTTAGGVRLVRNSIGMTLVRVPTGTFRMGSPAGEPGHRGHESPVHQIRLTRPFYAAVVPVTQRQYDAVVGKNPSHFHRARGGGPDHPVEMVTWEQAVRFCEKLTALPDEEIHRRSYRLPTEAEWEYCCRAGTTTPFHCGDRLTGKDAVFAGAGGKYAQKSTAPVASLPANAWGIHDVHGNVQEWVQDWYGEHYYAGSPEADPPGPEDGELKVVRGGCWGMFAGECRSAARRGHAPDAPSETVGFRVVMEVG